MADRTTGIFNNQGEVIPKEYDNFSTGIVYSAAKIKAKNLTAVEDFGNGFVDFDGRTNALNLTAGKGGSVKIKATTNIFNYGTQVFIEATPNTGYEFNKWEGVGVNNPDDPLTSTNMYEDRYIKGTFRLQT
jgi:hypothetical protein